MMQSAGFALGWTQLALGSILQQPTAAVVGGQPGAAPSDDHVVDLELLRSALARI